MVVVVVVATTTTTSYGDHHHHHPPPPLATRITTTFSPATTTLNVQKAVLFLGPCFKLLFKTSWIFSKMFQKAEPKWGPLFENHFLNKLFTWSPKRAQILGGNMVPHSGTHAQIFWKPCLEK